MEYQGQLSESQIINIEKKQYSQSSKVKDRIISIIPLIAAIINILMYKFYPNLNDVQTGNYYTAVIGLSALVISIRIIIGFFNEGQFNRMREKAALYTVIYLLLMLYDFLTLKTGTLPLPFFTWTDLIIKAMVDDKLLLLKCTYHSLVLLFSGYFLGGIVGTISGIAAGSSKKVNYWISPIMKILGPIPSTTWMPLILILASSLFQGSVFIIALGVWYPTTLSSFTGIRNIKKSYYDIGKTLGASKTNLIKNISIPAAMPNILQGWTQGMSVACTALMVAEMLGVEAGLGWYINWQKGWADYAKVYGAIIVICIIFVSVTSILNIIKNNLLKWQKGEVQH